MKETKKLNNQKKSPEKKDPKHKTELNCLSLCKM